MILKNNESEVYIMRGSFVHFVRMIILEAKMPKIRMDLISKEFRKKKIMGEIDHAVAKFQQFIK